MLVKPCGYAFNHIALVRGIGECMAFMFVNHQLSLNAERLERMPEFIRLRWRTFAVTVAN